ncbi:ShlB/FhaC/HecB family hemolysin secretion/activation protein [Halomonas borealis]|uniref:ShlB/FhaC/HecB family hemolysin secretion/activation protein n=1 Tax=Halomonas borealis TaxID=2508710 RepID=UPI001F115B59|nr:ShlB/FhaC/HecB family hemolysin secretion/activation protein [Halomonas borealis]
MRVEQRESDRIDAGLTLGGGDKNDTQVIGNLALHSHTPYAETLSFAYLMPVDNDDTFYAAQYRQELGTDGLRLTMSAQRFEGDEEETAVVGGLPYEVAQEKERDRYRLGFDYPLVLERHRLWNIAANIEHLNETADYRYRSDIGPDLVARQELRYSTLELGTRYRQGSADRRLEASAEVRQGIDLGASRTTSRVRNVVNGFQGEGIGTEELKFTRFALQGRWLEALTPSLRLSMRMTGFWSEDDLPAPEHGQYGASRFARGYDDGEAEGERGYAGEVELRYRHALASSWASHVAPYLVVDGAHTEFNGNELEYDLASVATGFELSHGDVYRLGLEYAYPIGDRPVEDASREGRINARLSWDFGG